MAPEPPGPVTPSRLAIVSPPPASAVNHGTLEPAPVIELRDSHDLPVGQGGVTITAALTDGVIEGTTSVASGPDGRATLAGLRVSGLPGIHQLTFSATGLTAASVPLQVTAGAPAHLRARSSQLQNGLVGGDIAELPSVIVLDDDGNPVPGVSVTFAVGGGGGQLGAATALTDANGVATLSRWTLGPSLGPNHIIASAAGDTLLFQARGVTAMPAALSIASGDAISVVIGQPLPMMPTVKVTDAAGQPVEGALVHFSVAGSAVVTLTDTIGVTHADGLTSVGQWSLYVVGGHSMTAELPASTIAPVTFHATAYRSAELTTVGTDNLIGLAGASTGQLPAVRVTSAGAPLPGMYVTFAVQTPGSRLVLPSAFSDANGMATAGTWTLAPTPGENVVAITAAGAMPAAVTFHAFGVAALPASMAIEAGDHQSATVLSSLPADPAVRLSDAGGIPIARYPVRFVPFNGQIADSLVYTDAQGIATAGHWTMPGEVVDDARLQVSAPQLQGSPLFFHATSIEGQPALVIQGERTFRGVAGIPMFTLPAVQVYTAEGHPLQGVPVAVSVTKGNGSVTSGGFTGQGGLWQPESWILGTVAGENELTVTVAALPAVTFTATGVGGNAVAMSIEAGNAQSGPVFAPLPVEPAVHLTDQYGNDSPDQQVIFTSSSDSRTLPLFGEAHSDSLGVARIDWRLGGTMGLYSLMAEASGLTEGFTATATDVTSPFDIVVRYVGSPSPAMQRAINVAVARWRTIVVADLPAAPVNVAAGLCFGQQPAINETVDDVVIYVETGAIDGAGGILGSAGPCIIRGASGLPSVGYMHLDAADVAELDADRQLDDVVTHEMAHILGIGTLWDTPLVTGIGGSDPRYVGAAALQAYHDGSGLSVSIPLENTGGAGTAGGHWRETTFGWELMTGYIATPDNVLSRMTVGALGDLGYSVDYSTADSFVVVPDHRSDLKARPKRLAEGAMLRPILVLDDAGREMGYRDRLR